MKAFIATVHILVLADTQAEAIDAISSALSENGIHNEDSSILDWAYDDHRFTSTPKAIDLKGHAPENGDYNLNKIVEDITMTNLDFQSECGQRMLDPALVLENDKIVAALKARDDELVKKLLDEEF